MKCRVGLFLILCFLFCSCTMNISNQEYIEIARGYLIENFGGEYTFVSLKKASENEVHVLLKSENLDNQEVNVQVLISDQKMDSYTCNVASNYLSLIFEKEEAAYYKDYFKTYFPDCNIIMKNEERFVDYYSVYWTSDEIDGEWIEHRTDEIDFKKYLEIIRLSKNAACADVIVTDNNKNAYVDSEDRLKCSLVDLQKAELKLDCDFYVVNKLDDSYLENWTFKAAVEVYNVTDDTFRYGYKIEKKE